MTKRETTKLLAFLGAIYGARLYVGDDTLAAWLLVLAPYEAKEVGEAVQAHLRSDSGMHPPNPGQLALAAEKAAVCAPDWGSAWREVMKAIDLGKPFSEIEWSSPAVLAAARCFGWQELRMLQHSELNTARAQFRDMYRAAVTREVKRVGAERQLASGAPALLTDGS